MPQPDRSTQTPASAQVAQVPPPGAGGPVTSVFTRVGAVVAVLGDYAASLISNDSGVAGATVAAALNTLNAAIGAIVRGPAVLCWGANAVGTSTTARFLYPWFGDQLAQTVTIQYRAPRAGTLRRFRVHHQAGAGNGNPIVYTVRINGVNTPITASLPSTSIDASDLVNTAAVAAGDLIDVTVTKALSIGASPDDITATLEFIS